MKVGSLFSGIGGLEKGLEAAGMKTVWQVENDRYCIQVLEKHWPDVKRYGDIRPIWFKELERVDLLCGGDPCQSRSKARSIHTTKQVDMFPDFMRAIRDLEPKWIIRENVPSKDAELVRWTMEAMGYDAIILEINAKYITGQNRIRHFFVGCSDTLGINLYQVFHNRESNNGNSAPLKKEEAFFSCLTTHPQRYDSRDNYIFEPGKGLRLLEIAERERLQGFPDGWTSDLSFNQRCRLIGNSVVPQVAEWIGRQIMSHNSNLI